MLAFERKLKTRRLALATGVPMGFYGCVICITTSDCEYKMLGRRHYC